MSIYVAGNPRVYAPPLLTSPVVITTALAINGNQLLLGSTTPLLALNYNSASSVLQVNPTNAFSGGLQVGADTRFVVYLNGYGHFSWSLYFS